MAKTQSHANCDHASNKAARAQCRRKRAKFTDAWDAVMAEAVTPTPVPAPEPIILDDASAVKELFDEVEAEGQLDMTGINVTRANWKDVKDYRVEMEFRAGGVTGNSVRVGKITGWGEKKIRYVSDEGKLNMIDTERLVSATVV